MRPETDAKRLPDRTLSKDEINRRIKAVEAELADLRRDIINGPQSPRSPELTGRRDELMAEIAALKGMLEKL